MIYLLYACASVSLLLALGGYSAWRVSREPALLISVLVSVVGALSAIALRSWWPMLIGFTLQFVVKAVLGGGRTR